MTTLKTADTRVDQRRIRVLCVDDHRVVREGLALVIGGAPGFEVVGSASNGAEAIALFRKCQPDITVMDLQMPGMSGLEALQLIRRDNPDARVVVLTMYEGDEDVRRAVRAGAAAYLLKDASSAELLSVLQAVFAGEQRIAWPQVDQDDARTLTPREIQVLERVSEGLRNKEIGLSLGISDDTVDAHLKRIFQKLDVHDRTAAVRVAMRRGFFR